MNEWIRNIIGGAIGAALMFPVRWWVMAKVGKLRDLWGKKNELVWKMEVSQTAHTWWRSWADRMERYALATGVVGILSIAPIVVLYSSSPLVAWVLIGSTINLLASSADMLYRVHVVREADFEATNIRYERELEESGRDRRRIQRRSEEE